MADPGTARSYGQALLDVVSSHEGEDGSLLELAGERVRAVDGEHIALQGHGVEVNLSDALGGTLTLVRTLVTMLRESSGLQDHELLEEVRRRFDALCRA
ncbi:hypothetical protein GCM10009740_01160 [Terrabacter terrae]|uniref:F-type ATPase subunit delta n=1 Tax=Terrabacter terrae TaxID=318434 RepID=A0ABP5F8J2_9MICO